jgi:hypothetical protein
MSNEISKMSRVVPAYGDTMATFLRPKQGFFVKVSNGLGRFGRSFEIVTEDVN